jgi:pimeloyl-ACP methyl ester carboxylesterase
VNSLEVNGHQVRYVRAGAGEPIIFLHNGGSSHQVWTPQIEHFGKTHDVLALDMLGFGSSGKPHTDYTLGLYVEMLRQFTQQLHLGSVCLVGNCMGAATALRYAMAEPERVRCVVAINVLTRATIGAGLTGPLVRLALRSPAAARAIGRLPMPGPVARAIVAAQFADSSRVPREILADQRARYRDPDQRRVVMSIAANMESFAFLDHIGQLPQWPPVLAIWGEQNRMLPAAAGRRLCAALGPSRAITVPGGHLPMLEQPEAINEAIESFIPATSA